MTHPSSLVLESFAVGEPLPEELAGHVQVCSACAAFVEQLRAVAGAGPSAKDADEAVARALVRRAEPRRPPWLVATSVVAPFAAAAAFLLLARGAPVLRADAPTPSPSPVATAAAPPGAGAVGVYEPETQFKGGLQVAVVRERGGQQARFSSAVTVRPGDRLRLEVALDREQAILGAVLADDGSYLELMPQAVRGPGTHLSERSAKIDAAPTRGAIVVGPPDAIARARATKRVDGVTSLRIEWEAP